MYVKFKNRQNQLILFRNAYKSTKYEEKDKEITKKLRKLHLKGEVGRDQKGLLGGASAGEQWPVFGLDTHLLHYCIVSNLLHT